MNIHKKNWVKIRETVSLHNGPKVSQGAKKTGPGTTKEDLSDWICSA